MQIKSMRFSKIDADAIFAKFKWKLVTHRLPIPCP